MPRAVSVKDLPLAESGSEAEEEVLETSEDAKVELPVEAQLEQAREAVCLYTQFLASLAPWSRTVKYAELLTEVGTDDEEDRTFLSVKTVYGDLSAELHDPKELAKSLHETLTSTDVSRPKKQRRRSGSSLAQTRRVLRKLIQDERPVRL
jgi:hypothetical protein